MAKKRYYNGERGDAFQAFPPDNNMASLDVDQSMFGFPASSRVISYPERDRFVDNMGGANRDSVVGTDYEIDENVRGLNRNKGSQRF